MSQLLIAQTAAKDCVEDTYAKSPEDPCRENPALPGCSGLRVDESQAQAQDAFCLQNPMSERCACSDPNSQSCLNFHAQQTRERYASKPGFEQRENNFDYSSHGDGTVKIGATDIYSLSGGGDSLGGDSLSQGQAGGGGGQSGMPSGQNWANMMGTSGPGSGGGSASEGQTKKMGSQIGPNGTLVGFVGPGQGAQGKTEARLAAEENVRKLQETYGPVDPRLQDEKNNRYLAMINGIINKSVLKVEDPINGIATADAPNNFERVSRTIKQLSAQEGAFEDCDKGFKRKQTMPSLLFSCEPMNEIELAEAKKTEAEEERLAKLSEAQIAIDIAEAAKSKRDLGSRSSEGQTGPVLLSNSERHETPRSSRAIASEASPAQHLPVPQTKEAKAVSFPQARRPQAAQAKRAQKCALKQDTGCTS